MAIVSVSSPSASSDLVTRHRTVTYSIVFRDDSKHCSLSIQSVSNVTITGRHDREGAESVTLA